MPASAKTLSTIFSIALPVPLCQNFDYLPPKDFNDGHTLEPGCRVEVMFGKRKMVGVFLASKNSSTIPSHKLKHVSRILDSQSIFPPELLKLCLWAAEYYHHPLGEVLFEALPTRLRQARQSIPQRPHTHWRAGQNILPDTIKALKKAPKQFALLQFLLNDGPHKTDQLRGKGFSSHITKTLLDKGLIESYTADTNHPPTASAPSPLELNAEQQIVADSVAQNINHYACYLLQGVTGSGKTEVYIELAQKILQARKTVLILVPEIGLVPQMNARFLQYMPELRIQVLHSGLSPSLRNHTWQAVRDGGVDVLIGTRSAVFAPLPNLGMIVLDEEHDTSYKQDSSFCYDAHSLAIIRARDANIPIILGSATPSLESFHNVTNKRFLPLHLTTRPFGKPPHCQLVDIRHLPPDSAFDNSVIEAMNKHLLNNNHVLVFLNRRGYHSLVFCRQCKWEAWCPHCDMRLTLHRRKAQLLCHYCSYTCAIPQICPKCGTATEARGLGTERIEKQLRDLFPNLPVERIDRDTVTNSDYFHELLVRVQQKKPMLLTGTQMLAKGHDMPHLTLVVIVDADSELFSPDFRAPERLGQLLSQVMGRAGRREIQGEVLMQTRQPQHRLLNTLQKGNYDDYAKLLLQQRQQLRIPPFSHLAVIGIEAKHPKLADSRASEIAQWLFQHRDNEIDYNGPLEASMARRRNYYRRQIIIRSNKRAPLHKTLAKLSLTKAIPRDSKARWSIDVDPREVL